MLLIPLGSSLMKGFSELSFRWSQFIIFITIIIAINYFDHIDLIEINKLYLSGIACLSVLLFAVPITGLLTKVKNVDVLKEISLVVPLSLSLLAILLIFRFAKKDKAGWILLISIPEISFAGYLLFFGNPFFNQYDWEFIKQAESVLGEKGKLKKYLLKQDDKYESESYRIYIPREEVYWDHSLNLNLNYDFQGLMTYDSTLSSSSSEINKIVSQEKAFPWYIEIENPALVNFFCN